MDRTAFLTFAMEETGMGWEGIHSVGAPGMGQSHGGGIGPPHPLVPHPGLPSYLPGRLEGQEIPTLLLTGDGEKVGRQDAVTKADLEGLRSLPSRGCRASIWDGDAMGTVDHGPHRLA